MFPIALFGHFPVVRRRRHDVFVNEHFPVVLTANRPRARRFVAPGNRSQSRIGNREVSSRADLHAGWLAALIARQMAVTALSLSCLYCAQ